MVWREDKSKRLAIVMGERFYPGIPDSDNGDLGSAAVWNHQVRCLK